MTIKLDVHFLRGSELRMSSLLLLARLLADKWKTVAKRVHDLGTELEGLANLRAEDALDIHKRIQSLVSEISLEGRETINMLDYSRQIMRGPLGTNGGPGDKTPGREGQPTRSAELTPEILEWARQRFTDEEVLAGLREIRQTGGLELGDFIHELEQAAGTDE